MSKLWNYLILHGWMSYLMTAGLLLFTSGFLLNRVSRPERSECVHCAVSGYCNAKNLFEKTASDQQICLERKARVVLLIVDALKYEFATWYNDTYSAESYHRNKLPIIHEVLQKYPQKSRLYKCIADPPTTTMQRLKGIVTGSLPTFIEIGSNFASEEIDEDNIIDQNIKDGVIFMGDDTWTNLFPQKFKRQFPSPSFNVWDLDTVDREVRYRIFFEMKKNDWSLLVAHTLGIDHCGHKHGSQHPEMTRKLNDTNNLIKEIVDSLEDDMILFVIGDHGMTETGDHGGDSQNEIEAAMFIYSKLPLLNHSFAKVTDSVQQIDLVPTLASILGTPVPFSNLGFVILDSLPSSSENSRDNKSITDVSYALHSVWRNIIQMKKYIDAYSLDSYLFSMKQLTDLNEMYEFLMDEVKTVNSTEAFVAFAENAKAYFKLVKDTCSEVWVQFDASLMSKGLILMFCTLFFFYLIINGIPEDRMTTIFKSSFLQFSVLANTVTVVLIYCLYISNILDEFKNPILFYTGAVSIFVLVILIVQNWDAISMNWYDLHRIKNLNYAARIVLTLSICCVFSNSYIVEEGTALSFLLVTLICLLVVNARKDDPNENQEKKSRSFIKPSTKSSVKNVVLAIGFVACVSVRLSSYFWRCREEQQHHSCSDFVSGKAGSIVSNGLEKTLIAVTLVTLALYITIIRQWLRNCGNLTGFSPTVMIAQYFPVLISVCIGWYWVLQRLPKVTKVKFALSWQMNGLPNMVYSLCSLAILILYYQPLSVYVLPKKKESIDIYNDENVIPRLFEKIKQSIFCKKVETDETPIVYGLGTAYSAAFISLSVFLMLLYSLLLGDILSPSTFLMFVTCASILGLSAIERYKHATTITDLTEVPIPVLLCWFLVAEYFFYGTGHQSTFLTIHWDAAFIGTGGHFYGNIIPAILIGINTFGSHIILGATLPLLVIVPFTMYMMFPKLVKVKFPENDIRRGELVLFERESVFHNAVFSVSGKYIMLHGIKAFSCMLAATIHCRHLMVWKIFAPKLIFEGLSFLVTLGSVLASLYFVYRIDRHMERLISHVTKSR